MLCALLIFLKYVARKIIRPSGDIGVADILNEIRTVVDLCNGLHENIVTVYKHGMFPNSYYFIDMECCDLNLEDYILRKWTPDVRARISYFTHDVPSRTRMSQLWDIMEDIAAGLTFIHTSNIIHRDLKPQNGIFSNI